MKTQPFHDPRAHDLLSRVGEDVSLLSQDVRNLVSHAARHTVPEGTREIAGIARQRLAERRELTAAQLRALGESCGKPAAWVGGALAVGLLAAGVYALCSHNGNHAAADARAGL